MIKAIFTLSIILFLCTSEAIAQQPSALLELESTTGGLLPTRMITAERDAIVTPSDGMIIFNSSTGFFNYYDIFVGWRALEPRVLQVTPNQTMFLGGSQFVPAKSTYGYDSSFGQGGARITTAGPGRLVAGIQLPVGTVINSITFYYKDNDPGSEMSMELDYESVVGGFFNTIMEYNTGVPFTNIGWLSETINPNHVLVENRAYRIDIFSSNWGGNMRIKGARINYRLPTN